MKQNKPRRGRPPNPDKLNTNIALRIRGDERKEIENCCDMLGMSMNRFVMDATLAVVGMINGTESNEPKIVAIGRFLRERGE